MTIGANENEAIRGPPASTSPHESDSIFIKYSQIGRGIVRNNITLKGQPADGT